MRRVYPRQLKPATQGYRLAKARPGHLPDGAARSQLTRPDPVEQLGGGSANLLVDLSERSGDQVSG